ncbi:putative E3 ubiquitin-protein ligase mug30 [Cladobotryum mycophilum]|uniref:HECT-type E3 ubiquitin transferase n=1 Tax=Cladobotryum mycophilum TaxID=491253 RepID=A0ABR0SZA2_9HYPO
MASWTPSTGNGSGSTGPDQNELIARIHNDALETPTMLRGRLGTSSSKHPRVQVESSSSDSDFTPSKPAGRRPPHSRSMSNPFPSFLGGKKKQAPPTKPSVELDTSDDDDAVARPGTRANKGGSPSGSKDFATGTCMTCASLVRWPKDLKVFKCTICMTVNDLVPLENDVQDNRGPWRRPETSHGPSSSKQSVSGLGMIREKPHQAAYSSLPAVHPISLEYTKRLVRQCLHSYITRRLRGRMSEDVNESARKERPLYKDRFHSEPLVRQRGRDDQVQDRYIVNHPQSENDHKHEFDGARGTNRNTLSGNATPGSSQRERSPLPMPLLNVPPRSHQRNPSAGQPDDPKRIFKPLEEYIIECFSSFECINSSFSVHHPRHAARSESESRPKPDHSKDLRSPAQVKTTPREVQQQQLDPAVFDLDPKLLLLGDVAENGTWWTGGRDEALPKKGSSNKEENTPKAHILTKSPQLNWGDVKEWYSIVNSAAEGWFAVYEGFSKDSNGGNFTEQGLQALEQDLLKGQGHVQRVLLKATEVLLKRPGRLLTDPAHLRFLLIILENPQLQSDVSHFRGLLQPDAGQQIASKKLLPKTQAPRSGLLSGQHSGIIKRIVGLISNSSIDCHNQLISWLVRYHATRLTRVKDVIFGFLTYRMLRQSEKKQDKHAVDVTAGLIPQMQTGRSGASLHDEIGLPRSNKKSRDRAKKFISYTDDWQIKAASRALALVFAANNLAASRRCDEMAVNSNGPSTRDGAPPGGQPIPASDFYNSMIDNTDLVGDFESWESKRSKFSFCQYPFLLSIWAKTRILEYDARRQMQSKARDAFFDSIMTRRNINQYLVLDVRRDCLVEDSLNTVSEVIGSGGEDLKKGLRISFRGEEGIDAGGLRKEWFLLLVREVFNPDHGMFVYDEDSRYCYFNPNSFEPSDQFFLVGVVMGLAIYNSTILDVALPPFAFRKLLASAPTPAGALSAHQRPTSKYTLDDLAEYRPSLAKGLRQLLHFDGDVEETFCLDFVVETDRYGTKVPVPLCPGGESKPVTNANRREYIDLYVRFILDTAVKRQFEPFKRGFYTVCGGNAFSLFRPEEIELLIRGSDEPLDIASLRAVAEYDNWESKQPDGLEPVVGWFWDTFQQAAPKDQRKMLLFITGSDRIPAMGAASLAIKITCLGDDCGRYPIARTCFNLLSLWRYESREKLEAMLWRAVHESEGFGLK